MRTLIRNILVIVSVITLASHVSEFALHAQRLSGRTMPALSASLQGATQNSDDISGSNSIDLSSAAGYKWEFQPANGSWQSIRVPDGGWKTQGFDTAEGTYRTRILIPPSAAEHVVRLSFAAVNFGATVLAGPDEAHLSKVGEHLNGWMPFSADLTAVAKPGEELLVEVQVKGREKYRLANGKFAVAEGASWFTGLADGILRGVDLQILPPVHVEDIHITTTRNPDLLNVTVSVSNAGPSEKLVKLTGDLQSWNNSSNQYPKLKPVTATLPAHTTSVIAFPATAWRLGSKSYWWPNVPYRLDYKAQLHILKMQVSVAGKVVERDQQRFGFRDFKAVRNHYELNGVRINLRGDNQQEANFGTDAYGIKPGFGRPSPSNGGWPEAVDNLLRLNFNAIRIHQIPATPYMLDVADEKGLMLIEESPLRGSEQLEDWKAGHDSMLAMDREMVSRDRNHPAVVVWSAANEWAEPIPEAIAVIRQVDDTRPIIADGVNKEIAPGIINMEHYVSGIGKLPVTGGAARPDRPYGETEAIWDADNTLKGFAWMATSIRVRRANGDADLRNYVLNNSWPNYVPGESDKTEILEQKVKKMGDPAKRTILPSISAPWSNANIKLMQQCYAPVAIADLEFDRLNAASNANGDWPTIKPKLSAGQTAVRTLTVFNDDLAGERLTVKWKALSNAALVKQGSVDVLVPRGEQKVVRIEVPIPSAAGDLNLTVEAWKDGVRRFAEDKMVFEIVP